jgi:hypothetical protein
MSQLRSLVATICPRRARDALACAALGALLGAGDGRADTAQSSSAVEAVWQTQTMDFLYHSDSQYFTCAELKKKLGAVLLAVGAHRDLTVAAPCPRELSGHFRATITLASPVEATRDNVRAVTTFTSTEQLLARISHETLPTALTIERFPAQWRAVSVTREATVRMGSADCELLQALSKQVFPRLSVRIIRDVSGCVTARIPPRLIVQALMPSQANLDADL